MTDRNGANGRSGGRGVVPLASETYTRIAIPPVVTIIGVTTLLYLGRDVLLPLAIALLLTFALTPIASFLRRRGLPRALAVVATVAFAFSVIALIGFLLASQITSLAQNLPSYQTNVIEKIRSLRSTGAEGGIIDRITGVVERVGAELRDAAPAPAPAPGAQAPSPGGELPSAGQALPADPQKPIPVQVIADQSPLEILENIIVPLISPFATTGLIIVVVIFMMLERETLRDRFIRLAGGGELHRTTEALQDAGRRVAQYLLMQLIINTTYAIPITIGLWLIGVPNAFLWGILTLVLRFVPYIGPAIGMILPMLVTFAALPGWSPVLMVAGLFILMELISNNIMEPWLYGSRTGLSSLAIIVSAIFWSWLWGPLGLVLSTPLTVCLVVLGRHVPQFEFLDVLLGNAPVLEPHARVYQRLLAGDPDEAADYAEDYLEDAYLVDFYEKVGIPALLLAEQDRQRGVMTEERQSLFARSAAALVEDLEDNADEEEDEEGEEPRTDNGGKPTIELPDGEGRTLMAIGGRGFLDDAASNMVAQVLSIEGAEVGRASHAELVSRRVSALPLDGVETVILTYLNPDSVSTARYLVRRLKRTRPELRVGLFMPGIAESEEGRIEQITQSANADFVAATIADVARHGFAEAKSVKLKRQTRRLTSRRAKPVKKAA